jgi:hypothetical protein
MDEDCDGVNYPVKDKLGKKLGRGKYFPSKSRQDREKRLSQYITTDSETGMIACIFCQKVPQAKCPSTRLHHLMEHIDSVHLKIMRYQCKFCDKKYPRNSQLSTHLKLKHHVENITDALNVQFSGNLVEKTNEDFDGVTDPVKMELSKLGRTKSRQDQHKRLFQYITTDSETGLKACTFCQKVPQGSNPSSRLKSLMDHIDSVHLKIMSHQCQFCDKKYPRKNQLCAHLKLKHGEEKDKKLQVPRSNYGPRNKLFPSMKNLTTSIVTITESDITDTTGEHPVFGKWNNSVEENDFSDIGEVKKELIDELSEASQVSDSQDRKKRLFQYITTDSETGLEACSFCQKVYQGPHPSTRQRKLMDHIDSVHLKVKSYQCQFCDKKYPNKSQLCTHLKLKHCVEKDKKVPRSNYGPRNKLFPPIRNMTASHVTVTESNITNITGEHPVFGKLNNTVEENYFSDIGEVKKELIDEHFENESVHEGYLSNDTQSADDLEDKNEINMDPFSDTMTYNPWQVESLEAFSYLKCPECPFDCKEDVIFQDHALENHPLSIVLFGERSNYEDLKIKEELSDTSLIDFENIKSEPEFSMNQSNQEFSVDQKSVYDKENPFSCHICQISFHQKKHYIAHITHLYQDGTKSFKCCACNKKCPSENGIRSIIRHIELVHKVGISNTGMELHNTMEIEKVILEENEKIEEKFVNDDPHSTSLRKIDYDSENPNSCNICKISFLKKIDHRTHIKVFQNGEKCLGCCACDAKFSWGNFRALKRHISAVHEGKPNRCNFCTDCFAEKEELEEHEASVHKGKKLPFNKFTCTICNTVFPLKSALKTHMETVHEDFQSISQKTVYDKEDPNSCNICQISFHQKQYYRAHVTSIQDGKKCFRCCACNATFSGDFRNFKRHIAVEHEEIELPIGERLKCDQCDKTYVNKKLLKDHVEIVHLQLKKYQCDQCPMIFASNGGFLHHVKSQHENRTYPCTQCNKTFTKSDILKEHVLGVHEKCRDFKCEYCGKDFPSLRRVNIHVKIIHKSSVKCDICDKVISNSHGLWKHKIFHHKEIGDALICEKCPRRKYCAFRTKASYDKHMSEVHGPVPYVKKNRDKSI